MKLTPLDIRHKEFTRAMRGYKDLEVDEFLDEIVEEFERLFNENIDFRDRFEALESKMEQYQNIEDTLKKTLISAQQQADELKQNSQKEADLVLRDAELKARSIINDSYAERQKVQRSVQSLKQKHEDLRYQIRKVIESYMNIIDQEADDATLEEMDELIESAPDATIDPAESLAGEAPAGESGESGFAGGERVEEGSYGEGGFAGAEGAGRDDAVRVPPAPEVAGDEAAIDDDPFIDLETDPDEHKFKW